MTMELLAPAGGWEQLQAAVRFGADAVYLAGPRFGMRARAANFALADLPQAVAFAHAQGARVHVTCNILMRDADLADLPAYFCALDEAGVDAFIIGDLGAAAVARRSAPRVDIHVSTQASVANAQAARVWHEAVGASRVVCARELSLEDVAALRAGMPPAMQLECFVHGAMCMAVSGRCLISSYLTGRSGNAGHCTQPCRWNYRLGVQMDERSEGAAACALPAGAGGLAGQGACAQSGQGGAFGAEPSGSCASAMPPAGCSYVLEEEKRPGVYFPFEQDESGSFIFNAKDLNMLAHLHELAAAGVDSIKIEGRNKKAFYVASVVNAYRQVLDGAPVSEWAAELEAVSHRPYSTGFYFGPAAQADSYDGYEQSTLHVADVAPGRNGWPVLARCRNRFAEGEELEALIPGQAVRALPVRNLQWHPDPIEEDPAPAAQAVAVANRSCNLYSFEGLQELPEGSFLRIRRHRRSARHEKEEGNG